MYCGEFGREPECGGADALERSVERVGGAAVALDVFDRGVSAGDTEPSAEQIRDRFGLGLARGEVGAGVAVGGEVQQHVGRFVGQGRELDMGGLAETAGDATAVGVAHQAGGEELVLELDVVAEEEGLERLETEHRRKPATGWW